MGDETVLKSNKFKNENVENGENIIKIEKNEFAVLKSNSNSNRNRNSNPNPNPNVRVLPDLRFEHSYLKSISNANGSPWKIFLITVRDQVLFPFAQGTLWALFLFSFRNVRVSLSKNGAKWGGGAEYSVYK